MHFVKSFAVAVALVAPLPAAAVTINTIAADFNTPVGGTPSSFQNLDANPGNERFNWGTPAGGPSGNSFVFASAGVPLTVATGVQFALGTFSYTNQPTTGTPLTALQLALTTTIMGSATPVTFLFNLGVSETPNAPPCPFPSVTPCSDQVTMGTPLGSGTFTSGGETFTLFIDGFQTAGGGFSNVFLGEEGATTTGTVIGRFGQPVPEPATWAMMVAGFGAMGLALRRPRRLRVRYV